MTTHEFKPPLQQLWSTSLKECPSFVMELYLQQILLKLQVLIKTKVAQLEAPGMKAVLEQSVTTLAAVADASKDAFI